MKNKISNFFKNSFLRISLACLLVVLSFTVSFGLPFSLKAPLLFVNTIAGSGLSGSVDGVAKTARFNWPTGVAIGDDGTVFVADYSNNQIRKIDLKGKVSTLSGSGEAGFADGKGSGAMLWGPDNIALDLNGDIIIGDADNFRIRRLTQDGQLTTIAGNGRMGFRNGALLQAEFGYPTGVAVDGEGIIYIADRRLHMIRKITAEGKVVILGGHGSSGFVNGKGVKARFNNPIALVALVDGTLFVADSGNNAIRKVTPDGVVTTVAGGKKKGYRDGKGEDALFSWPTGIAAGKDGDLFVCDSSNNMIRRISSTGVVSTIAGSLTKGARDGDALRSSFSFPTGIAIGAKGDIYIADSGNNKIRKISLGDR